MGSKLWVAAGPPIVLFEDWSTMKTLFAWLLLTTICFGGIKEQVAKIAVPRVTGTENNNKIAEYIKTEIGGEFQPFVVNGQKTQNVFVRLPGAVPGEIVVVAHYDAFRGTPGADDNASGAAMVLEMQKLVKTPRHTIVFLLVSGEEQGLLGSEFYVKQMKTKPLFALNIDMVGHLDSKIKVTRAPNVEPAIAKAMSKYPWAKSITLRTEKDGSDHAPFMKVGVPAVFLHTGLTRTYHKATDTPESLDYNGMAQILQYAVELLKAVDSYDLPDYSILNGLDIYKGQP